jgi:Domain of unknown function (DUF1707)
MAVGAAGRGRMRASHADREQAIEVLKAAFVEGWLTRDELDARAGRALAARTCADLAAVTAGIPATQAVSAQAVSAQAVSAWSVSTPAVSAPAASAPAVSGPTRRLVPTRRRPLARAAAKSGICLVFAAAALWASFILDPGGPGADRPWAGLMILLAQYAAIVGACIMWSGVAASARPRRSGRRLPPRPGPDASCRLSGH